LLPISSRTNRLAPIVNGTSGQPETSVVFPLGRKAAQQANSFKGKEEIVLWAEFLLPHSLLALP
jgi:hypothetical protein